LEEQRRNKGETKEEIGKIDAFKQENYGKNYRSQNKE
jgi:hypothetical protein